MRCPHRGRQLQPGCRRCHFSQLVRLLEKAGNGTETRACPTARTGSAQPDLTASFPSCFRCFWLFFFPRASSNICELPSTAFDRFSLLRHLYVGGLRRAMMSQPLRHLSTEGLPRDEERRRDGGEEHRGNRRWELLQHCCALLISRAFVACVVDDKSYETCHGSVTPDLTPLSTQRLIYYTPRKL